MPQLMGSAALGAVLEDHPLTCVDVGARAGVVDDLLTLAFAVDAHGFEADPEECRRLNDQARSGNHPFRSLRYHPVAIGATSEDRTLHLYRQRGCSSLLAADTATASAYSRAHYFEEEGRLRLSTLPLDAAARQFGFEHASYLKVDVQGADLEVLESAATLLHGPLVAVRVEVQFLPLYRGQSSFADIDQFLAQHGFRASRFLALHEWRRSTTRKLPFLSSGPVPFSYGELAHGDVLYLKTEQCLAERGASPMDRLRLSLLAMAYGHLDLAADLLSDRDVREYLSSRYDEPVWEGLGRISNHWRGVYRRGLGREWARAVRALSEKRLVGGGKRRKSATP